MTGQTPNIDPKAELRRLLDEATVQYENRKKLNQMLGITIGLLGIGLSLGATVSGIWSKDPRIAAIFGACAATTQAILFAYPLDKRAAAYRVIAAKNGNLAVDLDLKSPDTAQFQVLVEKFKEIRLEAALEEAKAGRLENELSPGSEESLKGDKAEHPENKSSTEPEPFQSSHLGNKPPSQEELGGKLGSSLS